MGSKRNRRRGRAKLAASQAPANGNGAAGTADGNGDRYQKYLPSWMKDGNGALPRPPRPRRPRQPRSKGGYTPGKMVLRDVALDL